LHTEPIYREESKQRFVVLDIETTGLIPQRGHRIIEIGAVALQAYRIVAEFHSLIQVQRSIPRHVQQIHGISNEMLQGSPGPEIIPPQFHDFIRQSTLVAHNAKFDLTFLRYELARYGLSLSHPAICTLEMSRNHYPFLPNHKLETVAQHLLGELPASMKRHRALDDARLTAMVWIAMKESMEKQLGE